MLAIRMQRTGRKGHAEFRVVVQDSRRSPSSGKIVAQIGHYNPHTKEAVLAKDKAEFYLKHGAQPSDRVAKLLKAESVKLPKWVELEGKKKRVIRNPEKLRRNRPAEAAAPAEETPADAPVEETATTEEAVAPVEQEAKSKADQSTEASPEAADSKESE